MSLEAVLFDNDGTLVDTRESICQAFHHAFQEVLGLDYPDSELLRLVGQPLRTQMEVLAPDHADELLDSYRAYNRKHHDELIRSFAHTEQALRTLKTQGIHLAVVTSKMHALAEHGLALFGIDGYFDELIGSDDCERHKPEPDPLLVCARRLGVEPGCCMYVGDSPYDLQAAHAAGMYVVAALWGMFDKDVLVAERPDYLACDIMDVIDIVKSLA